VRGGCRRRFVTWGGFVLEVEVGLLLPRKRPWWFLFGEGGRCILWWPLIQRKYGVWVHPK
jgi:hypothetical protein